jgi:imidazole glycerol-phosphate synthase subunit HisH
MIAIIEGCGSNKNSINFALERIGAQYTWTVDPDIIRSSSHILLPGVGHAQYAMQQLQSRGVIDILRQATQPVLGICLGMQLLFESSEEGYTECLSITPGKVERMANKPGVVIPHMGWNQLELLDQNNPIVKDIADQSFVYFVHSYCKNVDEYTVASTQYSQAFSAIVQYNNFYGMQFHPEKSGDVGEQLLKNFESLKT